MTGYGKASAEYQGKKIIAEVKSLNSKALDLSTRVASAYREKEMEVRTMITQALERGKVEFNLWTEQQDQAAASPINAELVAAYYRQMQDISAKYDIPEPDDYWNTLIRMPDVLLRGEAQQELTEEEWQVARGVVQQAVDQLVAFRRQEGEALQKKFEEKQRLANHLRYFRQTMLDGHGQGKKLGFIAQEMGREINTTGSKSNLAEMQNIVVRMKDELEQIKEQVLNVM